MRPSLFVRRPWPWASAALLALLAACGSTPKGGGPHGEPLHVERDGAGRPPRNLDDVPDAVPRIERLLPGANRPYDVGGRSYVPITNDKPFSQRGLASWYGSKFHGRPTASGEPYDMYAMTAAHPTLPLPSYARVRNPANHREVIVRINDRGPFHPGRVIDLSYAAAYKLGLLRGVGVVEVVRITQEEIRSGERKGAQAAPAESAGDAVPAAVEAAAAVAPAAVEGPGALPSVPAAASAVATDATGAWWVQLGAFRDADGASGFRRRVEAEVDWLGPLLAVVDDHALHRLQAGPYATRDQAQDAAQRIREALQLVPVVVERRN